ncbi:MAG: helix-turn-helix transcriptional regulator [Lachnospiraceae bacterium]
MKLERHIGILSILLQREKVTAKELAKRFEVSRRTIQRDIEQICCAGIPLVTMQGKGGGISIMEGFKLDKTLLSSKEMQAILTGLKSLDSVSGTNTYRILMEKLSAGKEEAHAAEQHTIIDLSRWDKMVIADKIERVREAIEQRKKLSFCYCAPKGDSIRVIEPYHLVFQWASWYVWGYCTQRKDYRMFKLTRMTDVVCTEEAYEPRNDAVYTSDKLCFTKGEVHATVRFDRTIKWRIMDEFGAEGLEETKDGDYIREFDWEDLPSFLQYILTFGEHAEIIEPQEYRIEFQKLLQKIKKRYEM